MVIKTTFVIDISILGCSNKCDHIRENQPVSEKKEVFKHEDANENKYKKCILLQDEVLDWLQIWTAASLLNVNGNKAIKKMFLFFSLTGRFSEVWSGILSTSSPLWEYINIKCFYPYNAHPPKTKQTKKQTSKKNRQTISDGTTKKRDTDKLP